MLEILKREANTTYTENGAVTNSTTYSDCLDLFATIGALRRQSEDEIVLRFMRAYAENPDLAMKLLFFARDVRGGLGERKVFRTVLRKLAYSNKASVVKNIEYIAEFGRYDDLLSLIDTPCEKAVMELIQNQLTADEKAMEEDKEDSLLAKWLPSVNASNTETVRIAKRIANSLGMSDAQYRKTLVKLRARIRIIENNLREKDYSFDYSKQPSKAMLKYRSAFYRNDGERFSAFIESVASGETKLHTGTLTPYDIIEPFFGDYERKNVSDSERRAIDVTWNAQEDFTDGENALVVVDGSGSMYGGSNPRPIAVALSLGVYFAERNKGEFNNHFITFSQNPQLVEIKGSDIFERIRYCSSFCEVANTNIQGVFELVLKSAVNNNVPQSELPSTLYFISDMEFDSCTNNAKTSNFEYAKKLFEQNGYKLPRIVFWNVDSRNRQQPVTMNEQGVVLVSGSTSRAFSMIKSDTLSPYGFMIETLTSERYKDIAA